MSQKQMGLSEKVLDLASIDARIRQLEAKYDLLQYQVDGWSVWPLLRFGVVLALHNPSRDNRQVGWSYGQLLATAAGDLLKLTRLRKARYLVHTCSSARSEQVNGLYKDIYFDDLLLDIGDFVKIETLNSSAFASTIKSALIPSDMTTTAFRGMAALRANIGAPHSISELAHELTASLESALGRETLPFPKILSLLSRFYWSKKLYTRLLERVQPERLLVGDFGRYNIVAAAKELGIEVIEFQHGVVYRYHPGYSWSTYAVPYKPVMPIPDRIFLYGEYWKQELASAGFWDKELCVVGSLRMDWHRNRATKKDNAECFMVVTTQGTDTAKLIAFMSEFLKLVEGQLPFRLYFKLHPGYDLSKEPYENAFQANPHVHVLLGSELPSTFELLTRAHLHISVASTCHYEALALGTPTVILPLADHEIVLHLHQAGHAFLTATPQDLAQIVLRWREHTTPPQVSEYYFRPHALENIKRELER